jgi:glutamate:GABA antiporter
VQAGLSALVLLLSQINETTRGAYQTVIDITIILYFIPFLYMFAAAVKLAGRPDRKTNQQAVLIPGGKAGVWIACTLAFSVTLLSILVSMLPPGDTADREIFLAKVVGTTLVMLAMGLFLYWRGARQKQTSR